jgi:hypothetical protein
MFAAYIHSVRESINKRMALVLIGLALLFAVVLFLKTSIAPLQPRSLSIVSLGGITGPASLAAPSLMAREVQITGGLWLLLAIFASVPLLVSMLEKGWVELTLTKGVARWRILLGCYFSGLTLYAATLAVAMLPTAVWIWLKTGVDCKPLLLAILIETLGFASLMAIASFATLTRTGAAIPVMLAVVVYILNPFLANRKEMLFPFVTSNWARFLLDWAYRILPKSSELVGAAMDYLRSDGVHSWFPFWTTGLFVVVTMGATMWMLHRKSL